MSDFSLADRIRLTSAPGVPTADDTPPRTGEPSLPPDPAALTRAASSQTYATIRLLADRDRMDDAFRAYAYFRWVDDQLDEALGAAGERADFLARQRALLAGAGGDRRHSAEEGLLLDLLAHDNETGSGLRGYLRGMMAVMAFDVARRGGPIDAAALDWYVATLATAVSDALFHFIGHDEPPPRTPERTLAVRGACVLHMLRDAAEDVALGYVNVPGEYLAAHKLAADDFAAPAYRAWVQRRVALARRYLADGRAFLAHVPNARCRLAGRAYMARFEWVARAIERDGFILRPAYPERKSLASAIWMLGRVMKTV